MTASQTRSHRDSYWKTISLAAVLAAASLATLVILGSVGLPGFARVIAVVILAAALAASMLVVSGGVVCLWRDSMESAGKPDLLANWTVASPMPGLFSRLGLRSLLGSSLRRGDYVRVKRLDEIEATLDEARTLNQLPFMPEMERYCGRVFQVHRRVDKVNDMRHKTGLRRMRDAVTLIDLRCDGSSHGDCQAECLILWKEAWLERLPARRARLELEAVSAKPRVPVGSDAPANATYVCQMTQLWFASSPMSRADIRQDLRPLLSGNIGFRDYVLALLTRLFNLVQRRRGGAYYPSMGESRTEGKTPLEVLQLRPSELVTIRRKEVIAPMLVRGRTRGLWFDRDMIRYCGQPAAVRSVVRRVIHEATGEMVVMRSPSVTLESVIATGEFLRLCPQHEFILWREGWLDRRSSSHAASPVS